MPLEHDAGRDTLANQLEEPPGSASPKVWTTFALPQEPTRETRNTASSRSQSAASTCSHGTRVTGSSLAPR